MPIAAANFELNAEGTRIQLLPYGEFRATDGRPDDVPAWYITEENGQDIVDLANNYANRVVVDYEHQTLNSRQNGQPAPAAGWMDYFHFTPQGIFADVEWTAKARQMIQDGEYRYISAVFSYDTQGYVRKIHHASLTNFPALDGMQAVAASADLFSNHEKPQEINMDLIALLRQLLNLPEATEQELHTALSALHEQSKEAGVAVPNAFEQIAALKTEADKQTVDLTQYVPIQTVTSMQEQIAALSAEINKTKADGLIEAALKSGKLLPAQREWAENLAKTNLAALTQFIDSAPAVAALTGQQTTTAVGQADKAAALTQEQKSVADALGYTEQEYRTVVLGEKSE